MTYENLEMPMEQLPVLVFADGRFLCQSYAIARYLAREHGNNNFLIRTFYWLLQ